jgi:hypothetical protein
MIYDNSKPTILTGFGVTDEEKNILVDEYIHGSRGDILDRICNDETMPPNIKALLLVEFGVRLVFDEVDARQQTSQRV